MIFYATAVSPDKVLPRNRAGSRIAARNSFIPTRGDIDKAGFHRVCAVKYHLRWWVCLTNTNSVRNPLIVLEVLGRSFVQRTFIPRPENRTFVHLSIPLVASKGIVISCITLKENFCSNTFTGNRVRNHGKVLVCISEKTPKMIYRLGNLQDR